MDRIKLHNIEDIKNFTYAGNATITLESGKTGKWFTFHIKHADPKVDNSPYFVSVLRGPSNTSDFSYMGIISQEEFKLTAKSKITTDALAYKVFMYFFTQLKRGQLNADLNVYHAGTCGRCGRKLTTPESISKGMGPECSRISKK